MSLPAIYRVAFHEASQHYEDLPAMLADLKLLEDQLAKRQSNPAPETKGRTSC